MLQKNNLIIAKLVLLFAVLITTGCFYFYEEIKSINLNPAALFADQTGEEEVDTCALEFEDQSARINCWIEVLRDIVSAKGTQKGFDLFSYIYQNYPDFSDTGCHLHAHRMGDIAYYSDYLVHQDLEKMEFPVNAKSCGYGFYHGFIEHFIQDHPEPEFVNETCQYLVKRLNTVAPGLETVCYHAGGHGFMMARADDLRDPSEWTIPNFTNPPLDKCDEMQVSDPYLKTECRQGVFNVFVNWMEVGEYGINYDVEDPYGYCNTLENEEHQYDCYVEMTRKIEYVSGPDPVKALEAIRTGIRQDMHQMLLIITVAGMVMHDPYGDQRYLTEQCRDIDPEFFDSCFFAITHGLFEHGIPGAEYKLADQYCSSDFLNESERNTCYSSLASKLPRFRTQEEVKDICEAGEMSDLACQAYYHDQGNG